MTVRPRARFRLSRNEVKAGATGGASATDLITEIRRVAADHAPPGGYGDTAWNAATRTVHWIPADWTTNDEVDAARGDFMSIDGVENVEDEAEGYLPTGEGWETVWPVPGSEEAYERVLELAERPLQIKDVYAPAMVPASAHYRPATIPGRDCGTCSAYKDGYCTMFPGPPPVQTDMVCDDWNPLDAG